MEGTIVLLFNKSYFDNFRDIKKKLPYNTVAYVEAAGVEPASYCVAA